MKETNPIKKERYENLKKASALPFGKRMLYYFDFFKFHFLALLILSFLIFLFLKEIVFAPEIVLNGYIVNRTAITAVSDEDFISSFPPYNDINPKKEKIYFSSDLFINDSDIESSAKLIATASSGDVDFLICNEKTFDRLCQMCITENLDDHPDLRSKYGDRLKEYDHTKNDTSEDDHLGNHAYGIDISDSVILKSFNAFNENEKVYLCLGLNSEITDIVSDFIDWISL